MIALAVLCTLGLAARAIGRIRREMNNVDRLLMLRRRYERQPEPWMEEFFR